MMCSHYPLYSTASSLICHVYHWANLQRGCTASCTVATDIVSQLLQKRIPVSVLANTMMV